MIWGHLVDVDCECVSYRNSYDVDDDENDSVDYHIEIIIMVLIFHHYFDDERDGGGNDDDDDNCGGDDGDCGDIDDVDDDGADNVYHRNLSCLPQRPAGLVLSLSSYHLRSSRQRWFCVIADTEDIADADEVA